MSVARIFRDAYGVPHVQASSLLDLAHGQGRVTAHDRTWQLEWQRRRATGTTAELVGRGGVSWDRVARRARIADLARRAHQGLSPETRAFVASYVAGVNAGWDGDAPELTTLGVAPQPWEPWTPLAVFAAQHLLFATLPHKLWRSRARRVLGADAELISHEGPAAAGSNAWAVGAARTATGYPLIAGDPHRVIESPGVYQQVRLTCTDPVDPCDVVGLAFPGVPGVPHFGHAGQVAWAITNASADYQDVYAEQLRRRLGRVEARGPDGWEAAASHVETIGVRDHDPVRVEVVSTARGELVEGGLEGRDEGTGLSLRSASGVLGDLGFASILPLLRARSAEDVDRALDAWVEPVNNVLIADRAGSVRYRVAGRIPVRADGNRQGIVDAADPSTAWTGWLDPLPRHEVPADGAVVTANERRGPESDPVGSVFAPPYRAHRLHALLADRDDWTVDGFAALHGDTVQLAALPLLALLPDLSPGSAGAEVRRELEAWDGRMEAESAGAAAFAAWRSALARRIAEQPVFAALREPSDLEDVHDAALDLISRIALALPALVTADRPFGLDLRRLAGRALDDAADHPASWGESHVVRPVHAFDTHPGSPSAPALPIHGVSGDADCVRCTASLPGHTDACSRGSVARFVWDLADVSGSGWVVPLGADGDPRRPHHHDQLEAWVAGRAHPGPQRVAGSRLSGRDAEPPRTETVRGGDWGE